MRFLHAGAQTTVIALWQRWPDEAAGLQPGRYRPSDVLLGFLDGL